jgi:phosphoribosylformimino-5-aminoimidazole carboxamide ribonucleotide (ProFAR) isomerase
MSRTGESSKASTLSTCATQAPQWTTPVSGLHVIASDGVASLDDIRQTYEAGLSGVIIGRALYEGQVALEDALRIEANE